MRARTWLILISWICHLIRTAQIVTSLFIGGAAIGSVNNFQLAENFYRRRVLWNSSCWSYWSTVFIMGSLISRFRVWFFMCYDEFLLYITPYKRVESKGLLALIILKNTCVHNVALLLWHIKWHVMLLYILYGKVVKLIDVHVRTKYCVVH